MNISADILIGRLSRPAREVLLSMDYNDVVPATGNIVVNLRRLDIARWSEDGELRLTERGRDVKGTLHAQREQREATVTVNTDILISGLTQKTREVLLSMDYYDAVPATGNVVVNLTNVDLARWSEDGEFRLTKRGRDVKEALHVQKQEMASAAGSKAALPEAIVDGLSTEVCDLIMSSDGPGLIRHKDSERYILGILLLRNLITYVNGRPVLNRVGVAVREVIKSRRSAIAAERWWGKPAQAAKTVIGTSRQYLVHETEDFGETWKKHDVAFTSEREATEYARQHISEWGGTLRVVEKVSEYLATEWIYRA